MLITQYRLTMQMKKPDISKYTRQRTIGTILQQPAPSQDIFRSNQRLTYSVNNYFTRFSSNKLDKQVLIIEDKVIRDTIYARFSLADDLHEVKVILRRDPYLSI